MSTFQQPAQPYLTAPGSQDGSQLNPIILPDPSVVATSAKQDAQTTALGLLATAAQIAILLGYVDGIESLIGTSNTSLASIFAKLTADPSTATLQTTINTSVAALLGLATTFTTGGSNTIGTSSGQLVAASASRKSLLLINYGTTTVWLARGGAAVVGQGIYLPAGASYEISIGNLYTGAINAIVASGTGSVSFEQGV